MGFFNRSRKENTGGETTLEGLHKKGVSLGQNGKYKEAIECFDKMLEINPQLTEAWNNKGITYMMLREYDKALECFSKALSINPKNIEAENNRTAALMQLQLKSEGIELGNKLKK